MLDEVLVVFARSRRLKRLPCKDVTDSVEAISPQARKVRSRILFGEGTLMKGYIVAIEEVGGNVRWLIGFAGKFGVSGEVDATEDDLTAMAITKLAVFNQQAKRRHDLFCSIDVFVDVERAGWGRNGETGKSPGKPSKLAGDNT